MPRSTAAGRSSSAYRNDPDQEVKEYCAGADRPGRPSWLASCDHLLKRCLGQGSFIFRGQITAAESLDPDVLEAAKKHLASVAEQVFDRYAEAPVRADTALAEKFLRAGNLKAVIIRARPAGAGADQRRHAARSGPTTRRWSASATTSSATARSKASG